MGKVAGAAVKAAAPEAALAAKVPGAKKAAAAFAHPGGKGPVPDPRRTAPGSAAARQRQAVEDVKARRPAEDTGAGTSGAPDTGAGEDTGTTSSSGGGLSNPFGGMQGPATGGGFVLGVMAWALVRAYIGNPGQPSGPAGVKRLLAAKFLNKTSTTGS